MPYMPHDRFHDYFDKMNVIELQEYMKNLLIALRRVHEFHVIHRDLKPSNFLHDRKNHKFLLVDFGLAQTVDTTESTKPLKINTCKETPSEKSNNKPNEENTECDNKSEQSTSTLQSSQAFDCMMAESSKTTEKSTTTVATATETQAAGNCSDLAVSADLMDLHVSPSKTKRKLSESDVSENQRIDSANPTKRARTLSEHHQQQHQQLSHQSTSQSYQNTSQQQHPTPPPQPPRATPYIPSSQFKTPLKQMNEISKQTKRGTTEFQSPLSADVKSTVLSYSIGTKIENQRNSYTSNLSPIPKPSSKVPYSKNIADSKSFNTSTPTTGRKYNLDNRASGRNVKCFCYGRPTVCNICLVRKEIQATRAGTPGYRPTEVLLKYPNQTTAVDCWAAGLFILLYL